MKRKTILFTSLSLLLGLLVSCGGDVNSSIPTSVGSSSNTQTSSTGSSTGSSSENNINSSSEGDNTSSATKDSSNTPVSSEDPHTSDDTPVSSDEKVSSGGGQTSSETPESSDSTGGGSSSETVRTVTSITFDNYPKRNFNKGDEFTLKTETGNYDSTLNVTYDDNSTAIVNITLEMVKTPLPNMNQPGTQTVTIQYGGKEITYEITISMQKIENPEFSFTYQSGDETKTLASGDRFYVNELTGFKVTIVPVDGVEFEEGVDYNVVYSQNEEPLEEAPTTPGTYDVRITTLASSSKVVANKTDHRWYIIKQSPTEGQTVISLVTPETKPTFTHDGQGHEPANESYKFKDSNGGEVNLTKGNDFTVRFKSEELEYDSDQAPIEIGDYTAEITITNDTYIFDKYSNTQIAFSIVKTPIADQILVHLVLEKDTYEFNNEPVNVLWHFEDEENQKVDIDESDYEIKYTSEKDDPEYGGDGKTTPPKGIAGKNAAYALNVTLKNDKYQMKGDYDKFAWLVFHINDATEPTVTFSIENKTQFHVGDNIDIKVTIDPGTITYTYYYCSDNVAGYEESNKNKDTPTEIGDYSFVIDTVAADGYASVHKWVTFSITAAS